MRVWPVCVGVYVCIYTRPVSEKMALATELLNSEKMDSLVLRDSRNACCVCSCHSGIFFTLVCKLHVKHKKR